MKRTNKSTIQKYTNIQLIDKIEDILVNIDVNNGYIQLVNDYIFYDPIRNKDISDKANLLVYHYSKEKNKQAYINLLDDIKTRNNNIVKELKIIMAQLKDNIQNKH